MDDDVSNFSPDAISAAQSSVSPPPATVIPYNPTLNAVSMPSATANVGPPPPSGFGAMQANIRAGMQSAQQGVGSYTDQARTALGFGPKYATTPAPPTGAPVSIPGVDTPAIMSTPKPTQAPQTDSKAKPTSSDGTMTSGGGFNPTGLPQSGKGGSKLAGIQSTLAKIGQAPAAPAMIQAPAAPPPPSPTAARQAGYQSALSTSPLYQKLIGS